MPWSSAVAIREEETECRELSLPMPSRMSIAGLGEKPSAPRPCRVPRRSRTWSPWTGADTAAVMFDIDDLEPLKALLSSVPREMAAQAESHGVIMPMTVYIEA